MKNKILAWFLLSIILFSPTFYVVKGDEELEPFFSISILAPNTHSPYFRWEQVIANQLPKIGIGIDIFDLTGWYQIFERSWNYPGPYPIPTYQQGGYDILEIGWNNDLDWELCEIFNSDNIVPFGENCYQFSNAAMDSAISLLNSTFSAEERSLLLSEMQNILLDELPQISVHYGSSTILHSEDLIGWDPVLWSCDSQLMYDWSIPLDHEFHYAFSSETQFCHPFINENSQDHTWLHQIYCGLMERNSSMDNLPTCFLAKNISTNDSIHFHVTLKDNLTWADGVSFTTDDVIYNYQLALTSSLLTDYSDSIVNQYGFLNYFNHNSITKISDQEFEITLLKKSLFPRKLFTLPLIPKHIWNSTLPEFHFTTAEDWAINQPEKIIGMGPFKLSSYNKTSSKIHLAKNNNFTNWFGSEIKFDDIYFKYYENENEAILDLETNLIDMIDPSFYYSYPDPEYLLSEDYSYNLVFDNGQYELAINMNHPFLGTGELCPIAGKESAKHIRKAISYLIPREIICKELLDNFAIPGSTAMQPISFGFNEYLGSYAYSLDLALTHMSLAGFNVGNYINNRTKVVFIPLFLNIIAFCLLGSIKVIFVKKNNH